MATAVISASLPTIRPVIVHFCRFIGLSHFVSSMGGRSRGISLPERSNQKSTAVALPSLPASVNREEANWLDLDHLTEGTDIVCHSCESGTGLCRKCHNSNKSETRPIITKTTEIHHEYELGGREDSDGTSQKQEVQAYSAV
jgi:hypothetical protein